MANNSIARVPYVAQNDAATGVGIRCGAAAIQAILYGKDNGFFNPSSSAFLKTDVPVVTDQDMIWTAIKDESRVVAPTIGGRSGVSEERQLCDPAAMPECWATHPTVMGNLIKRGVDISSGRLNGTGIDVQLVPEPNVVPTIQESLGHEVGAALLIERTHWVIVYRCEPTEDEDFDIYFHDPAVEAETRWHGIEALNVAVVDAGPGSRAPGTQTIVVGARPSRGRVSRLRGGHALRARPAGGGRIARSRQLSIPRTSLHEQLTPECCASLEDTVRKRQSLDAGICEKGVTSILPVRNRKKNFASYFLMQFGDQARVAIDAATYKPILTARELKGRRLPPILDRGRISGLIDGESVKVNGSFVTLDKSHFRFEEDLAWELCDQSRSPLVPFYVVRQPREGKRIADTVYVRATDGQMFPALTRTVQGV